MISSFNSKNIAFVSATPPTECHRYHHQEQQQQQQQHRRILLATSLRYNNDKNVEQIVCPQGEN